jgi:hypothetical protein
MFIERFKQTDDGLYVPFVRDDVGVLHQVASAPQWGPQEAFLAAPEKEVGLIGNRGGGKSDIMLDSALANIGHGYGAAVDMIMVRPQQREWGDMEKLSTEKIKRIWGESATYNTLKRVWTWRSGERLAFHHASDMRDWPQFQGANVVWIGVEELTLQKNLDVYYALFSLLRSHIDEKLLPRKMRFTANPGGPAHNLIKARFNLHGIPQGVCGPCITDEHGNTRRVVHCNFDDNALLKVTTPDYLSTIEAACQSDPSLLRSWRYGDWDIVSGGFFDWIFAKYGKNIFVPRFKMCPPPGGKLWVSYDHGSTKPWACLYFWESDGSDVTFEDGRVRSTLKGDLFQIGELYGSTNIPNTGTGEAIPSIVSKIYHYELARGWRDLNTGRGIFKRKFADGAIFSKMNEICISEEFAEAKVRVNGIQLNGIQWEPVYKEPGSRITSAALLRERLVGCAPREESRFRESVGLFIVEDDCPHTVRTVPVLQRDKSTPDDIDSDGEDHIVDAQRYLLMANRTPGFSTRRRQGW